MRAIFAPLLFILLLSAGCDQRMAGSGAYKPLDPSPMFQDGRSSRGPVPGTVPRGALRDDDEFYSGRVKGVLVTEIPTKVTPALLKRGQERFDMYCSMCHGRDGYGNGIVIQRGFTRPPSYHSDNMRNLPVGHFFDVITYGKGAMYPYASRVTPEDRWAIAAYIRALQFSQFAPPDLLSESEKQTLNSEKPR